MPSRQRQSYEFDEYYEPPFLGSTELANRPPEEWEIHRDDQDVIHLLGRNERGEYVRLRLVLDKKTGDFISAPAALAETATFTECLYGSLLIPLTVGKTVAPDDSIGLSLHINESTN